MLQYRVDFFLAYDLGSACVINICCCLFIFALGPRAKLASVKAMNLECKHMQRQTENINT